MIHGGNRPRVPEPEEPRKTGLAVRYRRGIIAGLRSSPTMPEVPMPRRAKAVGLDSSTDLARKVEILEREMATQREALERLKQMAAPRHSERDDAHHAKRSA